VEVPVLAVLSWPILERIPLAGDVAVSPHGIGIALGFLFGAWVMRRRVQGYGVGKPVDDLDAEVQSLLAWVLLAAIVGARGFYVLNHLDVYLRHPASILAIWHGGLTLLGGIAAAVAVGVWYVRRRGWDARRLLDAAAPGLAAGIAIGRFGDLAIGDHIGAPAPGFALAWRCTGNYWQEATNSFGYVAPRPYPADFTPVQGCFDVPVVQTALFDVFAATVTLLLVLAVQRWWRSRPWGALAATFVVGYGTGRLLFDFFREDDRYLWLTASQWVSLSAVVAALSWLALRARHSREPEDVAPEETHA
jgi:phosphatidylglycerol:prolipoprotein diacylglycerol transferase